MTDADLASLQQAASRRAEAEAFADDAGSLHEALASAVEAMADALIRQNAKRYHPEGYRAYLRTPHWLALREHMLKRAGGYCTRCHQRRGAIEVHHLTYRNLGSELESDLLVLCRECHQLEHS